ncbi:MAG: MFS transporter [Trebonia sp.]
MPTSPGPGQSVPAADSRPERAAMAERPWLTLVSVSLGVMMLLLDTSIVSVANPVIGRDLGGSLADLQWVTSAFLLTLATGLVAGGKLGDHYGRRRLFMAGAICFALTSAGCGLSTSMGMLIGFRVAQGLAGAAMLPQTLSTLRATFPPQRFQVAVGIYVAVSSVAIASGPIVGGVLVQDVGWRSIFFINIVIGAVLVAAARAFVPETSDSRSGGIDTAGVLLLAAALFCLLWAIVNSSSHPWGSGYTLAFLAAAVILLSGWAARMTWAAAPLIPLSLFRSASFAAGIGVVSTAGFTLYGTLFYLMLYLQRVQGHSPITAGAELLPLTVLSGAAAPLAGQLAHRFPLRLVLASGLLLGGVGAFGLTTVEVGTALSSLWPWYALIGIGVGCSLTGGSQAVVGSVPPARAGVATGIQQTSINVGGALATAVLGSVMVASVGDNLPSSLASNHLSPGLTAKLEASKSTIAQGVVPHLHGLDRQAEAAVVSAAQQAVTSSVHLAFTVIAAIALAAGLAALGLVKTKAHHPGAAHAEPTAVGDRAPMSQLRRRSAKVA